MRRVVFTILCFVSLQSSANPPFGLRMGMSLGELEAVASLKPLAQYQYEAKSTPAKDPRFARYSFFVVPGHGLCRIVARTHPVKTDAAGAEYQDEYQALERSLIAAYGEPTNKIDGMKNGLDAQPNQWLAVLRRGDRCLNTGWLNVLGLGGDVQSLALNAGAFEANYGATQLFVDFSNARDCMKVVRIAEGKP